MPNVSSNLKNLIPCLGVEGRILLDCVKPAFDPKAPEIQDYFTQFIDWTFLLQLAEKHRVIPLLYQRLNQLSNVTLPPKFKAQLRVKFYETSRQNLQYTNQLLEILSIFEQQNIAVIPYKGVLLAMLAYGKVSFRQIWDIDLLIHPKDVLKSRACLLEQRYKIIETFDREQSFVDAHNQVEIDLHWGLTPLYFHLELPFSELWEKRRPIELFDKQIMTFSEDDLLIILCIQIAKDCWERRLRIEHLSKICDIGYLIHRNNFWNWRNLIAQAQQMGIERVFYFGLSLAQELLSIDLPTELCLSISKTPSINYLRRQVCQELFCQNDKSLYVPNQTYMNYQFRFKQLIFYLKLRERPIDRIKHISEIFKFISRAAVQS
ncbi:MAG: nucleotidyltransferase family protein [Cyanobacteria bacterium P01_H01_bin.15]